MKIVFSTLLVVGFAASSFALTVDAKSNIFGAGLASPPGTNPGILPPSVAVGGATSFTFSASGLANAFGGTPDVGPEGYGGAASVINSAGGISGYRADRRMPLVGVFLAGSQPGSAPATIDFQTLGVDFLSLSPELGQVFFIGDGVTSSNVTQEFFVPVGATELYLGTADAFGFNGNPGYYNDNTGGWDVTVTAVPEPASLLGLGLAGLFLRRKRSK